MNGAFIATYICNISHNSYGYYLSAKGILSELVIFGDKLFANVAGPKEDSRTLYSVLAAAGQVTRVRGNWREVGF